jgi:hypothetical protein
MTFSKIAEDQSAPSRLPKNGTVGGTTIVSAAVPIRPVYQPAGCRLLASWL